MQLSRFDEPVFHITKARYQAHSVNDLCHCTVSTIVDKPVPRHSARGPRSTHGVHPMWANFDNSLVQRFPGHSINRFNSPYYIIINSLKEY